MCRQGTDQDPRVLLYTGALAFLDSRKDGCTIEKAREPLGLMKRARGREAEKRQRVKYREPSAGVNADRSHDRSARAQ